jgi:hypothetical protein
MSFNMLWGKLQNVRVNGSDFREMLLQQLRYAREGQDVNSIISELIAFQRNWMGFTIPSMLRSLESIQGEVLPTRGVPAGNYEFYLREIEGLYQPQGLVELEEYGLPLPLGMKLVLYGLRGQDIPELLSALTRLGTDARIRQRLTTVEQWILDDVILGLLGDSLPTRRHT